MKRSSISVLFFSLFFSINFPLFAQSFLFEQENQIPVSINGKMLTNAWAGGLNAPQFSTMKLNHDSIDDLVVFDRSCNKLYTFLAVSKQNTYQYEYSPEHGALFPNELNGWFLLADFDRDGRKDIFTHANLGIRVYKNITREGEALSWQLIANPVNTQGFSGQINLQVSIIDIPSIVDVDDDGDLDIITFDFIQGSFLEYHKNLSIEQYNKPDSLLYKRISNCWGGLFEGRDCGDFGFGMNCQTDDNESGGGGGEEFTRVLHLGSTITVLDLNGDKQKDILIGDVSCNKIFKILNKNTNENARFDSFDSIFPPGKAIDIPIFPAVFSEDVDFDGKKDLLASPNTFLNYGNMINFYQSAWFYKNKGTNELPDFRFKEPDFLQNTMIDLGENTYPTFADLDADGDLDMLLGNGGKSYRSDSGKIKFYATLTFYKNTGNSKKPQFELIDEDYLNLSSLNLTDIRVSLIDINEDKISDLCFTATQNRKAFFYYIPNQANKGKAFDFDLKNIQNYPLTLQLRDCPLLADTDKDGDLDLLIGRGTGNLAYYQNKGNTQSPDFLLISDSLLHIQKNTFKRNLQIALSDLNLDGKAELITGNLSGEIKIYPNFLENLHKKPEPHNDWLLNSFKHQYISFKGGSNLSPALADLDGDKYPEMIVGTKAGGLLYFKNTSAEAAKSLDNPSAFGDLQLRLETKEKMLFIQSESNVEIEILEKDRKKILGKASVQAKVETPFDLSESDSPYIWLKMTKDTGEKLWKKIVF